MACSGGVCSAKRGTTMASPMMGTSGGGFSPIETIKPGSDSSKPWYSRLGNWLLEKGFGKDEVIHLLSTLDPQQTQISNTLGQSGLSLLQDPYQGFDNIEKGALQTFNQQIVPGLLERFTASGDNSISSGTIKQQLSQAGAGLAERLQGFKEQFAQQNRGNALQQLQLALNPRREFLHSPGTGGLLGALAPTAGMGLGMYGGGKLYDKFFS